MNHIQKQNIIFAVKGEGGRGKGGRGRGEKGGERGEEKEGEKEKTFKFSGGCAPIPPINGGG
jgi:hypothetical protein